jgi:Bacterial SH3 domain
MSGKKPRKAGRPQRKPPAVAKSELPNSANPGARKYGVPVLRNLALAGAILTFAFLLISQSDRIARFAKSDSTGSTEAETIAGAARIVGTNVPIRSIPKMSAKILERAVWGESVEVVGREGEWAQIRSVRKTTGWISRADLKF